MANKKCKRKKKYKNRGGEKLAEWRVYKEFGLTVAPLARTCSTPKVPFSPIRSCHSFISETVNIVNSTPFSDVNVPIKDVSSILVHGKNQAVEGRRIVDIMYFVDKLKALSDHAPQFGCTLGNMDVTGEVKRGLRCGLIFKCNMCGLEDVVYSEPNSKEIKVMDVNSAAVAGVVSAGGGFANLTKVMGAMNIRCMGHTTFEKHQAIVFSGWEQSALEEMKVAAEEEAALARERGDVDKDGVPLLTVVADGSWSKRSYRSNYNSLSGMVAIVGYHSNKVLYFGVKNKYCVICTRSANKDRKDGIKRDAPKHTCFRNWNSSSSSMEPMAIVEGFMLSEEMYGVRYSKLIADGDSSVYSKILEFRPYDTLTVEKVECRNHLLRNYSNKLRIIATTSSNSNKEQTIDRTLHMKLRRVIGGRILRCRTAVTKAVAYRKSQHGTLQSKADNLRKDLINGPSHVFGEHGQCKDLGYFCDGVPKDGEYNYVEDMKQCGIYHKVMVAVNCLADYSRHLIQDVDSNIVEQYNSTLAMFTGGKRTNLIQRNSYRTRCAAAVVKYNTGRPFYKLHKSIVKSSPGDFSKLYEGRAKRKAEHALERRKKVPKARRSLQLAPSRSDKDYGPNAQKPDLDKPTFELKTKEHLKTLKKTNEEIFALERLTVNQRECKEWLEERRIRLTASNFGLICNRRPESNCGPVVAKLLYSKIDCIATRYGQAHEEDAIKEFEQQTGTTVAKCGLFVDQELPWLAASPDGLVGDDAILEVKCPITGKDMSPEELVRQKKGLAGSFWEHNRANNTYTVKKRHCYHFQVQGQLHICNRQICYFTVWTPKGVKVEKIERDDSFWLTEMLPKLERFYFNCLLPELIDPRRRRNMPIREPTYIRDAQTKKQQKLAIASKKT